MSHQRSLFGTEEVLTIPVAVAQGILHYLTEDPGGWQTLFRELVARLTSVGGVYRLSVDADLMAKVERYAYDYGNGGWQNALRALLKVWRPSDEFGRPVPA